MSTQRVQRDHGYCPRSHPKGTCRRCGGTVPKGRRTFCGDQCVHEWKLRTQPGYVRGCVERRDHGVCAACGVDCGKVKRILRHVLNQRKKWMWTAQQREMRDFLRPWGFGFGHLWEADHIVPVIEGGGECGLENYRTLCRPCHRVATAELRARLAKARKQRETETWLI